MRNIEIADANILLRYLLKDIPEHFAEACEILENIINNAIIHTFDQKLKKVLDKHTPTGVK